MQTNQSTIISKTLPCQQRSIKMEHPIQPEDASSWRDPSFKSNDASQQNILFSRSDQNNPSGALGNDIISYSSRCGPDCVDSVSEIPESFGQTTNHYGETLTANDQKYKNFLHLFDFEQKKPNVSYVLLPTHFTIRSWNFVYFFANILLFIYLPLRISFTIVNLDILFIVLKLVDIGLLMVTGFARHGQYITQWRKIAKHYINHFLFRDAMILIGLAIQILLEDFWRWTIVIVVMVLVQLRFKVLFQNVLLDCNLLYEWFNFLYLLILINFLVCLWENTINGELLGEQAYLTSLFYVISLLTFNSTYTPSNDQEILMFSLITCIAPFVIGYIIITLSRIMQYEYLDLQNLNAFFKRYHINNEMKQLIMNDMKMEEQQRTPQFSISMMRQINHARRYAIIAEYFKGYEETTLNSIVQQATESVFEPDQKIITHNETENQNLYFLLQGISTITTRTGNSLGYIQAPQQFNESSFYTQADKNENYMAETQCITLKIDLPSFLNSLSFQEKELFFIQRDLILYKRKYPKQCSCCHRNSHNISKCPELNYLPSKLKIIRNYLKESKNKREEYNRRRRRSHQTYQMLEYGKNNREMLMELFGELDIVQSQLSSVSQLPYEDGGVREISFDVREKSAKLSNILKMKSIHDQGDIDDDEIQDLIREDIMRNDQQKQTLSTAGFPNQTKRNKETTLNIILEQESSELDEDNQKQQRSFENESNSCTNSERPQRFREPSGFKMQHRQSSQKLSLDSWAVSPIVKYQRIRSSMDKQKSRNSTQTKSFKSGTQHRGSNYQSTFNLHQNENYLIFNDTSPIYLEFERMHLMTIYNIHNNYDKVIEEYNHLGY